MRRLASVLVVLVAGAAAWIGGTAPASANTLDSFTLSASSVMPGDTVTATATWSATDDEVRDISIAFPSALTASWASASTVPSRFCVTDSPPTQAACLWNAHVSGATITLTAVLTVASNATPGTYPLTAAASIADTNGPLTRQLTVMSDSTPAIAVAPTSATPGSTAVATGTFTALTTGDIHVGVFLNGTGGNGTFGTATGTTGLTGCTLDGTGRAFDCLWSAAVAGQTRAIVIPVNVGAGATAGQTWDVSACSNANTPGSDCDTTQLAVIARTASPTTTPTTTSPTTTPTTAATASATTSASASSSAAAVPTAVPAGEGPLAGSGPWPWLALLGTAGVALLALAIPRRSGQHR